MNTVSLVGSVSRLAGGLFESVRRLHQELLKQNPKGENWNGQKPPNDRISVSVLGVRDEFTESDLGAWAPVPVHTFEARGPHKFSYGCGLSTKLAALRPEIVHVHGLWQYTSVAVSAWHHKFGKPYLVSPHGMLDPWALRNSLWKKRLAWLVFERKHLNDATCLRALCQSEADSMRVLGLRNPICIIPNGVDLPPNNLEKLQLANQGFGKGLGLATADESSANRFVRSRVLPSDFPNRKVLLYHGRIHPKKGLPNLLRAWAKLRRREEWLLAIAGWDQDGHEAELKQLAGDLQLVWGDERSALKMGHSVVFTGPQYGAAKEEWLQRCKACILPSFSEGLPMAALEAWAHAKPVLLTPQCNLPEGFSTEAAVIIGTKPDTIVAGLQELFHASSSNLDAMGSRGLALVRSSFAWPKIAADLRAVYYWLSAAAPKPDCVLTAEARCY